MLKEYKEIISGVIIFIFAAVYFIIALSIPEFNDGFISSDFMPKIYGVVLMLLSAFQIAFGMKRQKKENAADNQTSDVEKMKIAPEVLLTFIMLVLYVAFLNLLGFLIATILFLLGMVTLFTPKEKRSILKIVLISVVFSLVVYLIFVKGFSLTLPEGILG